MDPNEIMSDLGQPAIEDMGSGTCAEEKQNSGPRVSDDANRVSIIVDSSVHTDLAENIHPVTDESISTKVGEEEPTKCVVSDTSVGKPLFEDKPNDAEEASILQLKSTSRTIEQNESCEDEISPTEALRLISPQKEPAPIQKESEPSETENKSISFDNVVAVDKESSPVSAVDEPSESVVSRDSEKVDKSLIEEIGAKEVGELGTSEAKLVALGELGTTETEDTVEITKKCKMPEENGASVDENEVEIVEGATICTSDGSNEKTNVKSDILDESVVPRKRGRRPKRNRSETVIVENGSPGPVHDGGSLDDLSPGRPRRKAAQKAGDQIKQIVGNEEDVSEVLDKGKGTEEWTAEPNTPPRKICYQCCRLRPCQYHLLVNGVSRYMCTTPCFQAFRRQHPSKPNSGISVKETLAVGNEIDSPMVDIGGSGDARLVLDSKTTEVKDHTLECAYCHNVVPPPTASDKSLSWETMEFCNAGCLGKYQDQLSTSCSHCKVPVQKISMGKYCVRFGYHIKQFCCSTCLEEFKKGLKTCTYCQKDISNGAEGFLAPVGDKGQFKDFCTPACMEQYDHISSGTRPASKEAACAVCDKVRPVISEVVTRRPKKDQDMASESPPVYSLCSEPCFAAFKFVNEVKTEQCESCLRYFDTSKPEEKPTVFFHDGGYHCCCRACLNIFILTRRSIVQCNWCRVKKYDFDMIKRISSSGQVLMMCSLNCLSLYHVSVSAVSSRRVKCDYCDESSQAQYHLTMSDATVRNFCSYECVMIFQSQYSKTPLTLPEEDTMSLTSTTGPSSKQPGQKMQLLTVQSGPVPAAGVDPTMPPPPIIAAVHSLAPEKNVPKEVSNSAAGNVIPPGANHANISSSKATTNGVAYRQILVKPPNVKEVKNKSTSCKPITSSKSVECQTSSVDMSTQTEEKFLRGPILIPVPVPIYVPMPIGMYSYPFPVPTPFPLPIPVPIVVPSKLSLKEIVHKTKEMSSVPPEEAEILMMAELVANEEKEDSSKTETRNSNSPTDDYFDAFPIDSVSDPEVEESQEPMPTVPSLSDASVDLEESIAISKVPGPAFSEDETSADEQQKSEQPMGRKRKAGRSDEGSRAKRSNPSSSVSTVESEIEDEPPVLKASLGVSAWQVWVQQKNSELSKVTSNSRRLKLFKTELLQMTLEELNYALCLFVKEVRKPGGGMYAPDTILYFCLGIQHYLMENGRVDNIFTDLYFEKFTECLDQVATTFPPLTKETKLIATRVEEEHLWESRQLGAHSPYVLLSTLVFFNTKYFHLWTVEDHAKLTFANIIKVWKKPRAAKPSTPATPEPNTSLLRLIQPEKLSDKNLLEKKVYEQHENTTIPIRCPVKHYEFYMSKCPDPLKKVGDVFYLLPERACVPDSPVWYSSTALGPDALSKILHRIQMVKEVNKSYADEYAEHPYADESEENTSEKEEVV